MLPKGAGRLGQRVDMPDGRNYNPAHPRELLFCYAPVIREVAVALEDQFKRAGTNGTSFRPLPFWSWNDDLEPEELVRQVDEMARVGLGGHFMHARAGLITEYMGSEWNRCIKETVQASKRAGVQAWLYDEDCWPSGAAGGAIPAMSEDFVSKTFCCEMISPAGFKPTSSTIAAFLVRPGDDGPEMIGVAPKVAARRAKADDELMHFYYQSSPDYTDLLNPKAVKEFIRHTYGGYSKLVGREFGKTIPGIFTDEPQWRAMPWSSELPKFFKKLHGYDLIEVLPSLVRRVGDFRAVRYDFWRAATELFVTSFTKQIGEWCAKHKLALTGHMMEEDNLRAQLYAVGSAMPHYEHMQIPGIDHLRRQIADPLVCKQVSSVAHQMGGRRVLSEMFGCSGWNVSLEELKWMAEWQFVLGVDMVCPHLSLYSSRGCRKRDYPPSLHYQQPWWDDYSILNDYFARLTFMLTRGKHVADVLVIHNVESAWAAFNADDWDEVNQLNADLVMVSEALLGMHVDFDFADEGMLARHARVGKKTLRLSHCEYSVVVVPPCLTLRSSTLDVLKRFMRRGGTVIVAGPVPALADGRESDLPERVLDDAVQLSPEPAAIQGELSDALTPRIIVLNEEREDAANIYVQQRDLKDRQIYFLANTSATESTTATVRLPLSGRLERWDPETGSGEPLKTRKRGKLLETTLEFAPMASHLLVLLRRRRPVTIRTRSRKTVGSIELSDAWLLTPSEPNALTLDTCSYRVGTGAWSKPMHVLDVQDAVKALSSAEVCDFRYSFLADFSAKRPQELWLVMEDPAGCDVVMNGVRVAADEEQDEAADHGWWRDVSFRKLNVHDFLRPQDRNEIILRRAIMGSVARRERLDQPEATTAERNRLRYGPEIESVYLAGDFLVHSLSGFKPCERRAVRTEGPFVLVDNWHQATTGDLVGQGLPFYAGSVRLSQTLSVPEKQLRSAKGATLSLAQPDAIVTKVTVNGTVAAVRGWHPYEVEVGELLQAGRNEIEIELAGSCRNLLGPHHHVNGELHGVGPASFRRKRSWTDDYNTPDDVWTDAYSFVAFGLSAPVALTLWK